MNVTEPKSRDAGFGRAVVAGAEEFSVTDSEEVAAAVCNGPDAAPELDSGPGVAWPAPAEVAAVELPTASSDAVPGAAG